jgi:hypothetical protein
MKIGDKVVKNTYSDLTFNKRRVYEFGWNITFNSYRKNGKLVYTKKNELNW